MRTCEPCSLDIRTCSSTGRCRNAPVAHGWKRRDIEKPQSSGVIVEIPSVLRFKPDL